MSLAISSITGIPPAAIATPSVTAAKPGDFSALLGNAIQGLERYRTEADQATQNLLTGQTEELHTVALSVQKAELAFDLALQVRNKVVEAYQEVMRMQL